MPKTRKQRSRRPKNQRPSTPWLFAAPLPALLLLFSFSPITQQLLLLLGKVIQPTLPIIRVLTTRS
uniref:RorfII n=1 Tax=Simian T-lymphotropic virus 3 TaxID=39101 RepID=A0A0A7RRQ9_9DELA|nr:RorfII [Simian T-lymphotropic virus 3]